MSLLGARRVTELHGTFGPAGGYRFELRLDSGAPPAAGAVELNLGDLVVAGRVLEGRGGSDAPELPAVVFAGGAGWETRLAAGGYASPSGVRLSTVLADLARACGELYDAPAEAKLGPEYGWDAGQTGADVLADLVARGAIPLWRVDPRTGRAVNTAWPAIGAADARGRITSRDLARGVRYVALAESVASWLPGATVQGSTVRRLVLHEAEGSIRAEVWE